MTAVLYPGYWPDPDGYARYALGFIAAIFLAGVALYLLLLAASMVLPVPDAASREVGASAPTRRGRRASRGRDARDISAAGVSFTAQQAAGCGTSSPPSMPGVSP